ncbi:hypothetical protein [Mangrovicoccus ximenensis]|uniref:hypothetical protein n=1 Tax=Mangrovicoccus ximenensis TaxID=1911570 RepID=UPI000D3D7A75|nr:hypothetical protein [Mangrovicoccus ximenensis]
MIRSTQTRRRGRIAGLAAILLPLAACGVTGDTGAVRKAGELAVACRPDAALAELARAEASGGMAAEFAALEKVAILQEAGRTVQAEAALNAWNAREFVDPADAAETRTALDDTVQEIRDRREKATGSRSCP